MYVRMYVCMYVYIYICMYVCMYLCMYLYMYVCMYLCMVCMHECFVLFILFYFQESWSEFPARRKHLIGLVLDAHLHTDVILISGDIHMVLSLPVYLKCTNHTCRQKYPVRFVPIADLISNCSSSPAAVYLFILFLNPIEWDQR